MAGLSWIYTTNIIIVGRFYKGSIFFDYNSDYKEAIDEIIAKQTSDEYAEQWKKIEEHRKDKKI